MCNCSEQPRISYRDGTATIVDAKGKRLSLPIADAARLQPTQDKYVGWVAIAWGGVRLQMRSRHWQDIKYQLEAIAACCSK